MRKLFVPSLVLVLASGCVDDTPVTPKNPQSPHSTPLRSSGTVTESFIVLGTLGGDYSTGWGIDDQGQVVGRSRSCLDCSNNMRAFAWTASEGMRDLGTLSGNTADHGFGSDVSGDGYIVGYSTASNGKWTATLWDPNGNKRDLGMLGDRGSSGVAVSTGGQYVVGISSPGTGKHHAFRWTHSGGMQDLGAYGFDESHAYDVNDSGYVVGNYRNAAGIPQAFLWTPETGMQRIPGVDGYHSNAAGINNQGQIVGYIMDEARTARGFLYDPEKGITDLSAELGEGAVPTKISNEGRVIGTYSGTGFVWTKEMRMKLLPLPSGATQANAININSHGQVVGYASFPEGYRAVVWNVSYPPPNRAPTIQMPETLGGIEGQAITVNWAATDPDGDALQFRWSFGDGREGSGTILPKTILFPENGAYTITLAAMDGHGHTVSRSMTANVQNAAPVLSVLQLPGDPLALGGTVQLSATFTDSGVQDTHSATVDWGDGSGPRSLAISSGQVIGAYTYATAGVYPVTVSVADDDGGEDTRAYEYVVVYDPKDGFVTGGGWIDSPAGAFAEDASLTGAASFGFVSRYKTGASLPSGKTDFQFRAASVQFQSTEYEWLVISGPKAQYKGTGTLNGVSGYRFLLTATDAAVLGGGEVDQFRIKITDPAGSFVYDNGANGAAAQAITRGNIVVHKP